MKLTHEITISFVTIQFKSKTFRVANLATKSIMYSFPTCMVCIEWIHFHFGPSTKSTCGLIQATSQFAQLNKTQSNLPCLWKEKTTTKVEQSNAISHLILTFIELFLLHQSPILYHNLSNLLVSWQCTWGGYISMYGLALVYPRCFSIFSQQQTLRNHIKFISCQYVLILLANGFSPTFHCCFQSLKKYVSWQIASKGTMTKNLP